MPFGRRPTLILAALLATMSVTALGGCATPATGERQRVQRQAAIERWHHCLERQSVGADVADVRHYLERGCEGHRRDIVDAFPPHMAPRLHRALEAQAAHRLRARLGDRDPVAAGFVDVLSPG